MLACARPAVRIAASAARLGKQIGSSRVLRPLPSISCRSLEVAQSLARHQSTMSEAEFQKLSAYTACDVADALLKLDVPGAGFLADISPAPVIPSSTTTASIPAQSPAQSPPKPTIGRASTVLFVAKSSPSFPASTRSSPLSILNETFSQPLPNIPSGVPYSDLTRPGTIVVISQPQGQKCAVVGGIMAARMAKLGAKGIVVDGRVRDLGTLNQLDIPIWSKGTSIIGSGAEAKGWATEVPIHVDNTIVEPGDIIMIDPASRAVVAIPAKALTKVLNLLPALVSADEKVMKDVEEGVDVATAFRRHRGS